MSWTERRVVNLRLCLIAACLRQDEPMSQLCARFEISRKIGYKWLGRYRNSGAAELEDLSSARHTKATTIDADVATVLLALRRQRPTWEVRKLWARPTKDQPEID